MGVGGGAVGCVWIVVRCGSVLLALEFLVNSVVFIALLLLYRLFAG